MTDSGASRKVRESNFELLRLVSMFMIVLYHCLCIAVERGYCGGAAITLFNIPIHVAVPCFVMVSGWFHIRPSVQGAVRLLLPVVLYYCVLQTAGVLWCGQPPKSIFFGTGFPYWFVRVYLYLFLLAPLINSYLDSATPRGKLYMLAALTAVNVLMSFTGDVVYQHGHNFASGHNVLNFMVLYVAGDCLRTYSHVLSRYGVWHYVGAYVLFNAAAVVVCYACGSLAVGDRFYDIVFSYASPLMHLNAVLLFLAFSRLRVQSRAINAIAASSFAIYIITDQPVVRQFVTAQLLSLLMGGGGVAYIAYATAVALALMAVSIVVDQPVRRLVQWSIDRLFGRNNAKNSVKE